MESSNYQESIDTWNKVAKLYESKFMDLEIYNKTYDEFCKALNPNTPAILEIGCGPGNIAKYILDKVTTAKIRAIDVSENMIQLAKNHLPAVDFQVMDCRNLNRINASFDGIICGFTIPYLSPEDTAILISECSNLLNAEGSLYLSFVEGQEEKSGFITGGTGDRTYFYYHQLDRIQNHLEKAEMAIKQTMFVDYERSKGISEVHTILIAQK